MSTIRVLLLDDDEAARQTLASILEGEGWLIRGAGSPEEALQQLLGSTWHLVVARFPSRALNEPLFDLLKDLAVAEGPLRVLFLVPAVVAECTQKHLDWHCVPYVVTPIRLTDFIEQVSSLLQDAGVLRQPLRRVREGHPHGRRPAGPTASRGSGRAMVASRQGYFDYDEDDLRQFEEEEKRGKQESQKKEPA